MIGLVAVACGGTADPDLDASAPDAMAPDSASSFDARVGDDASDAEAVPGDASSESDSGGDSSADMADSSADAGSSSDAAMTDARVFDSDVPDELDSGLSDSSTPDASTHDPSPSDSGAADSNLADSSTPDANSLDSSTPDSGMLDSSTVDSSGPDASEISPCSPGAHTCDATAMCVAEAGGSYRCDCPQNYTHDERDAPCLFDRAELESIALSQGAALEFPFNPVRRNATILLDENVTEFTFTVTTTNGVLIRIDGSEVASGTALTFSPGADIRVEAVAPSGRVSSYLFRARTECGGVGDLCCDTGFRDPACYRFDVFGPAESDLICDPATNRCIECGDTDEPCCPQDACRYSEVYDPDFGTIYPGAYDELHVCNQEKTCEVCGGVNQPCCTGAHMPSLSSFGGCWYPAQRGVVCADDSGRDLCVECGAEGQPCCAPDPRFDDLQIAYCQSGLVCDQRFAYQGGHCQAE